MAWRNPLCERNTLRATDTPDVTGALRLTQLRAAHHRQDVQSGRAVSDAQVEAWRSTRDLCRCCKGQTSRGYQFCVPCFRRLPTALQVSVKQGEGFEEADFWLSLPQYLLVLTDGGTYATSNGQFTLRHSGPNVWVLRREEQEIGRYGHLADARAALLRYLYIHRLHNPYATRTLIT